MNERSLMLAREIAERTDVSGERLKMQWLIANAPERVESQNPAG